MKNLSNVYLGVGLLTILAVFSSCDQMQYDQYNNMQVVENTFTGSVQITSVGQDPAGDFMGNNKSGKYSFAWVNSKTKASANFDVTTSGGTVQMIINEATGEEVLNQTRPINGSDTFAGVSQEGKKGTWLITLVFTNLNGSGSFSIHPAN